MPATLRRPLSAFLFAAVSVLVASSCRDDGNPGTADAAPAPGRDARADLPRSLPNQDAGVDAPPASDAAAVADGVPMDASRADAPPSSADTSPADAQAADAPANQIPPQGRRLLDPWLAAGHHKAWRCEPAPVNARSGSPHGRTRICSNDLVSGHGAGPYPVGAASVKEIYYGARIGVYAVAVKVSPGSGGNSWYWYEQNDLEGVGAPGCVGCHARAERTGGNDHVFIQVK